MIDWIGSQGMSDDAEILCASTHHSCNLLSNEICLLLDQVVGEGDRFSQDIKEVCIKAQISTFFVWLLVQGSFRLDVLTNAICNWLELISFAFVTHNEEED